MKRSQDRLLNLLADIIARFIVGFAGAIATLWCMRWFLGFGGIPWYVALLLALGGGIFFAIFGLRKGPGAI